MLSQDDIKKELGNYASTLIQSGMTIGLGTGTTIYYLIKSLEEKIKQGMELYIVPTSRQTAEFSQKAGIKVLDLDSVSSLQFTIDGADEIDPIGQLVKGGGGALLQEKIVAAASERLIIIADHTKQVELLGKFPLPVEVIPFGHTHIMKRVVNDGLCTTVSVRQKEGKNFITDQGHYILDLICEEIEDADSLNASLHEIPGVVETGLFIGMAATAIIGYADGRIEEISYE
jgi:ribose 5-phosphate isomerase A